MSIWILQKNIIIIKNFVNGSTCFNFDDLYDKITNNEEAKNSPETKRKYTRKRPKYRYTFRTKTRRYQTAASVVYQEVVTKFCEPPPTIDIELLDNQFWWLLNERYFNKSWLKSLVDQQFCFLSAETNHSANSSVLLLDYLFQSCTLLFIPNFLFSTKSDKRSSILYKRVRLEVW